MTGIQSRPGRMLPERRWSFEFVDLDHRHLSAPSRDCADHCGCRNGCRLPGATLRGYRRLSRYDARRYRSTVAPALSPEEIEQQITFPSSRAALRSPATWKSCVVLTASSQVVVVFSVDGTDIYFARQLLERKAEHLRRCPKDGPGRSWVRWRQGWVKSFTMF